MAVTHCATGAGIEMSMKRAISVKFVIQNSGVAGSSGLDEWCLGVSLQPRIAGYN